MRMLAFLSLFLSSGMAVETSGTIEKGLRILNFNHKAKSNNFVVYRGDYVKFKIDQSLKEQELLIPDLGTKEMVYPEIEKSKLVKMTKLGEYSFSLGKKKGKIRVVEYTEANYKLINAKEAKELIDNVKPLILDVRTKYEHSQAHIPGSILISVDEIQERFKEIESHKNQDIFIYCASGNRSTVASRVLIEQGFKRIYNLKSGIAEWTQMGYPVNK